MKTIRESYNLISYWSMSQVIVGQEKIINQIYLIVELEHVCWGVAIDGVEG